MLTRRPSRRRERGSRSPGPQPVQDGRVGAGHLHDLPPACRSRDQRHGVTADTERIGYRGQRCRGGPAVHGPRGYPHHQGAIVLPAHARTRGPGADPDRQSHLPSVRPVRRPIRRGVLPRRCAGAHPDRPAGPRAGYSSPAPENPRRETAVWPSVRRPHQAWERFAQNRMAGALRLGARVCQGMRLTGGGLPIIEGPAHGAAAALAGVKGVPRP